MGKELNLLSTISLRKVNMLYDFSKSTSNLCELDAPWNVTFSSVETLLAVKMNKVDTSIGLIFARIFAIFSKLKLAKTCEIADSRN